jgi:hypothetical protein
VVEDLVCEDMPKDYDLRWRIYGAGGASLNGVPIAAAPAEIFIMAECLAPTAERAAEVVRTTKPTRTTSSLRGPAAWGACGAV